MEITTINDAVVRLGTASVRNVVATCMASRLQQGAARGRSGAAWPTTNSSVPGRAPLVTPG
jgi:hypothetical protein